MKNLKALSLLLCAIIYPFFLSAEPLDGIIASVNNEIITRSELEQKIKLFNIKRPGSLNIAKSDLERQMLDNIINTKLQLQLARLNGVEVDDIMLNEHILQIAKHQDMTLTELREKIVADGIDFDEFREEVKTELTLELVRQRAIRHQINITENDVNGYLSSAQGQDEAGAEYRLSHIVMFAEKPTPEAIAAKEQQVSELARKLQAGSDFAKAALSHSQNQTALEGGDMGWRKLGQIPTLFAQQVPSMNVGDVVGPLKSANGFHIIQLSDKRLQTSQEVKYNVQHILLQDSSKKNNAANQRLIKKLHERIKKGTSFSEVAKDYSEELSSAAKGGDIGWVIEQDVNPTFYQVLQNLQPKELSEPFKTNEGWHLIKLVDKKTEDNSEGAARQKARNALYHRKYEELVLSWIKNIRDDAEIEFFQANV